MSYTLTKAPRHLAARVTPIIARSADQQRSNSTEVSSEYPKIQAIREEIERDSRQLAAENRSRQEVSRDMGDEAESSRAASLYRSLLPRSQRANSTPQPRYSRTINSREPPSPRQPITRSLNPSWNQRNPSTFRDPDAPPRAFKGVHNRQKRAEGHTPSEANTVNDIMAQMLRSSGSFNAPRLPAGHPVTRLFNSPFTASIVGGRIPPRILEKMDSEEDLEVAEQLDALKEDMGTCRTDVDLIKWAKMNVFAPTKTTSVADADAGMTYPRVYPHILAHLLGYIRRNYSNPHLVLALFHHAQTQSPESYLSGCLAPAYTEVLKTQWESFKDLEAVEAGLREMEANGVGWDRGTAKTVGKIVDEITKETFQGTGWQEKYGKDVHVRLGRIEDRLQKDVNDQKKMYEAKLRERAQMRLRAARSAERREAYAEQESQQAAGAEL